VTPIAPPARMSFVRQIKAGLRVTFAFGPIAFSF
jgi:hypothetical protein